MLSPNAQSTFHQAPRVGTRYSAMKLKIHHDISVCLAYRRSRYQEDTKKEKGSLGLLKLFLCPLLPPL
jgi:hypothetical protein